MTHPFRPLLIAGYPRSGTSLFHSLVCTSPDVNQYVKECSWLTRLVEAYAYGRNVFAVHTDSYFDDPAAFLAYNARLLQGVLDDIWTRLGRPKVLALKDPELLAVAAEAAELLPAARIAVLVRDVRDVAASQVRRIRKQRGEPGWYDPAYVRGQGERYAAFYGRLADSAPALAGRVVCIRYETLVRDTPLAELERLLGVSGLDASRLWQRARFAISDFKDNEASTKLFGAPISASSIGGHAEVLTPRDAAELGPAAAAAERLFACYADVLP